MKRFLIALIKGYSYLVSPLLGKNCRFHPTCSDYTAQAIDKYGPVKGVWLGMRRIGRCHPWHKGDFLDPIP